MEDTCEICGHPFDPHILIAYDDPLDGGLMFCPDRTCDCVAAWSVQGRERAVMPPPHVVAEYRAIAHSCR